MSDRPDDSLPELTPGQESEVRRLLADARHQEPVPAEVAARLDAVLAGLTPDRKGTDEEPVAPVVDLAARRRRRNAAALLLGAAAVIVAGFGIAQVVDVGSGSDDAGSSTAAEAGRESAGDQQGASGGQDLSASARTQPAPSAAAAALPLRLSSSHLESDVSRQLRAYAAAPGDVRAPTDAQFDAAGCPIPTGSSRFGLGDLFPALFDGRPAVLAVRPPDDGTRTADVLDCDTASPLASVTIPAR